MKKYIPYITVLLSLVICAGRILYSLYSKRSISFEVIMFFPIFLEIFGFFFCKYTKHPKLLKTLNLLLIPLSRVSFYIVLEIID